MHIHVLIEPIADGRFRARAGEPFSASAEGTSADEATRQLENLLRQRLQNGNQLATIELDNGSSSVEAAPLCLDPVPEDDWFFRTLREAIAERRLQDEDETVP